MRGFLWYFFTGCVKIKVTGLRMERFIGEAVRRGIPLRRLVRDSYTVLETETSMRGVQKLRRLAEETDMQLCVTGLSGMARRADIFRRRWSLAVSLVLAAVLVFFGSRSVWCIRMECDLPDPVRFRVEESLREMGVFPGCLRASVDTHRIQSILRRDFPEIAFAGLRLRGTVLTMQIVAAVDPPQEADNGGLCHITADKAGVVEKVICTEGRSLVQPGDAVMPGDMLISGQVPTHRGAETYDREVCARGRVIARVHYRGSAEAPLGEDLFLQTGERTVQWFLEREGACILLAGAEPAWETSSLEAAYYEIPLVTEKWGWHIARREYARTDRREALSLRGLESVLLRRAAHDALFGMADGEIVSRSHRTSLRGGRLHVDVTYTVREDIAVSSPTEEYSKENDASLWMQGG